MKLMIILGSARAARRGQRVADWVQDAAKLNSNIEVDFVDSATLKLPFYNEPSSPFSMKRSGKDYINPEGKAWARRVGQADAILLVVAEYNHGYTALLKNTLDWVGPEWGDKPVAFVSYSTNLTGGSRAVEQLRPVATELGLIQVANAIHFPDVEKSFDENGVPTHQGANDNLKKMLAELERLHGVFAKSSST